MDPSLPDQARNERVLEFIKLDYEASHARVGHHDDQRFQVRSWAVTTAGAIVAVSLSLGRPQVILPALFTTLFFLLSELVILSFRVAYVGRCRDLEKLIREYLAGSHSILADYKFSPTAASRHLSWRLVVRMLVIRWEILIFYLGLSTVIVAALLLS